MLGNVFTADVPAVKLAAPTNGNGKHALASLEAKSLPFVRADFWPIDANGGTTPAVPGDLGWYRASWLAYACMRYRAQKLIEAPLWIAEESDEGEEWVEAHELEDLLEQPNPDMEMADLLELTSLYLDSTGTCLWVKNRDRGQRVGSLYPYSGDEFSVQAGEAVLRDGRRERRLFSRFDVRTRGGPKELGPDDVIYFRNADPADPMGAVAPLHAAMARLGVDRTMLQSIKHGLDNVVTPGASIGFPESVTKEQAGEWEAHVNQTYAAARNRGKTFLHGGGSTFNKHDISLSGLSGGELTKEIEAAVCGCFQLPPVVIGAFVGLANSSDRHNMETSVRLVYDNAILPTWSRFEKALTKGLLREVDPDSRRFIRFDKSKIGALQENQAQKADVVKKAERALTVDDARVMLGLEAFGDERGERMLVEGGIGLDGLFGKRSEIRISTGAKRRERKDIDPGAVRWALFDALATKDEAGWELSAWAQLEADRRAVIGIIEAAKGAAGPAERKDPPPPYGPASAEEVRRLVKRIEEHMDLEAAVEWRKRADSQTDEIARRAVERAAAEMGLSFDLLQPGLIEFTQEHAALLVTQVTETTKQAVRDALSAGLLEGESIPDLAKRIEDSGAFGRSRATLIARTEATSVANGAQRAGLSAYAAETGETIQKSWLATKDSRTRDSHRAMDGETRGIDEEFSNGLQAPAEPRCRCTLTYSMEDA